jgi:hypothetical protein
MIDHITNTINTAAPAITNNRRIFDASAIAFNIPVILT